MESVEFSHLVERLTQLKKSIDFIACEQGRVTEYAHRSSQIDQIAAALAAGNTVNAKPAEETPLIASEAIRMLHEAGEF